MNKPHYSDPERCKACGGECCRIYTLEGRGNMWFEDYLQAIEHDWFGPCGLDGMGIPAIHDPWISHMSGERGDALRRILHEKGYHEEYCQYHIPGHGCRIPWEYRPEVCVQFRCSGWLNELPLHEFFPLVDYITGFSTPGYPTYDFRPEIEAKKELDRRRYDEQKHEEWLDDEDYDTARFLGVYLKIYPLDKAFEYLWQNRDRSYEEVPF